MERAYISTFGHGSHDGEDLNPSNQSVPFENKRLERGWESGEPERAQDQQVRANGGANRQRGKNTRPVSFWLSSCYVSRFGYS